ncbi:MAG: DUF2283 domain-containing protein [Candidatus Aenigmarchaeota archaeon]|nr:DUF2283 domain-containing protein [Candidatus Aenigmarchaeota archaeon]
MSEEKKINKSLDGRGECDYDYLNDVLFFKARGRNYSRSIEMDRFVIDIDEEDFVVGMQIFDASEFLATSKLILRNVRDWKFQATVDENKLEIRLLFQVVYRNKITEKNPIIIESLEQDLPDSKAKILCNI